MASNRTATQNQFSQTQSDPDVQEALDDLMDIDGAVGAAVAEYESGTTLGTVGGRNLDMQLAGAGITEMVRSKKSIIDDLGLDEEIEDILISLDNQYHLVRMCEHHEDILIYLVIDREKGNLGLSRREIDEIDERLGLT